MLKKEAAFTTLNHLRKMSNLFLSFFNSSDNEAIWLYYLCLGHPSFRVLKGMFPKLFQRLDVLEIQCDICELAKHTQVSFLLVIKEAPILFI